MQQGGQPPQRRPYRDVLDALQERVRPFIERQPEFARPAYGSVLQSGADMLPGVGDVVGVEDLQAAARDGDPVGIGLGLLAAIPGIPAIGRGVRGGRRAGRLLEDAAPAPANLTDAESALARYRAVNPDDTGARVLNPGDEGYPTNAQWDDVSQTYVALTPTHQGAYDISVGGRPAGNVSMAPNGRPFVDRIQIDPAFQRQGVGGQVYDQLEETLGVPLVPSPLGLSDEAQGFWRKRLDALPPDQARHRIDEAMGYGQEFGVDAYDRLNPLRPQAVEPDYPIRAYHGSPHSFDQFSLDKIGTGEGVQAYGHGLYFAENEGVARSYRDQLSSWTADGKRLGKQLSMDLGAFGGDLDALMASRVEQLANWTAQDPNHFITRDLQRDVAELEALKAKSLGSSGSMYEVGINAHPDTFLDWDRPLSEQPENVRQAVSGISDLNGESGGYIWDSLVRQQNAQGAFGEHIADLNPAITTGPVAARRALSEAGVPGIRYLDAGSRGSGEGSRNYVLFDDELVKILRKYGISGLGLTGGAALGGGLLGSPQDQQAQPTTF
jgi:GNAT superfamily N-acetyltransferase